ncbi:acyclic terpene utilization AtuA family protein [Streptomyces sp. NPDC056405]|uniref:acyclic terpene utilization AtuA family protein n=1 Tax=Streptomyces sp. NPDC056405 TaxID=3345811 RepID=UPI0035E0095C
MNTTQPPLTRILTPTGMLGYGYPEQDFWDCVGQGVDAIVVDSGSTDPGPYLLALGSTLVSDSSYLRDLRPLLQAVHRHGIPLFIGSAGGAGTRDQVDHLMALVSRIAAEEDITLRVATVYADIDPAIAVQRLAEGRISPNVRGELPTPADIDATAHLVGQMGAAPFTDLIEGDEPFDVVIAGRAYDPAPHAAWAMSRGVQPGIAWHAGKILECGGACAEPKGGGVLATYWPDAFELTPMSPGQRCTPLSVAAHTLYEKARPDLLPGPDGVLDVTGCTYVAVNERTVRVTGSVHRDQPPTVKLEGAAVTGHRAAFIGGVRDPLLIGQLDHLLELVHKYTAGLHPQLADGTARLDFHVYGRDAVMGHLEPARQVPHEVGILGTATAPTPELAKAVATTARVAVLHAPYPGQLATAGNLALPLNPMDNPIGPVSAFTVYHVMDATGLRDLFPVTRKTAGPA